MSRVESRCVDWHSAAPRDARSTLRDSRTCERVARARATFRFTCQTAHSYRRNSSPLLFGRRGVRRHFPSLTGVRERSAGRRYFIVGTLRCRVPCDRHARLPALHRGDFGPDHRSSFIGPEACPSRYPGSIGAALHPMLSKPLKAGPSSGPDGDRASWDEVTSLACRRRTLLRQLSVPRRRPRLSKACRQYRVWKTAQE